MLPLLPQAYGDCSVLHAIAKNATVLQLASRREAAAACYTHPQLNSFF